MSKPFKTYRQQLSILRERGLEIKNGSKAISILKKENYYSIINGYKDIFIDKNKPVEMFKLGTTFEHIYALYEFDSNLRSIFLKNILKLENIIETKIAYFFSEVNKQDFSYLNVNNFDHNELENSVRTIATISNVINDKTNNQKNAQIQHYLTSHKSLPLWVLINQLTFGNVAYLYKSLTQDIKVKICNEITVEFKKEYKAPVVFKLDTTELYKILIFTNQFRNLCAHSERLYNPILRKSKKTLNINHINQNEKFKSKLIDVLIILQLFLSKKDFKKFISNVKFEMDDLETLLPKNIYNLVLIDMGFPKNWSTRINTK